MAWVGGGGGGGDNNDPHKYRSMYMPLLDSRRAFRFQLSV